MPRRTSLSFQLLETFVTLMENQGNAAKTHKQLDINQASMSKRLRHLQHRGPVLRRGPWLVREGKRWRLTPEGEMVLPAARELVSRYRQLTRYAARSDQEARQLAFACGRHIIRDIAQEALRRFCALYEDISLRVFTLRGEARIVGVANGSLDLATVAHDSRSIYRIARRKLHVKTITSNRLALVCRKKTPWADNLERWPDGKTPFEACADFPLILPEPNAGIRELINEAFRRYSLTPALNIRMEIGGWGTILAYVWDRHGVGLVGSSAIPKWGKRAKQLVVRYFNPKEVPPAETKIICRRLFAIPEQLDLSDAGKDFYTILTQVAAYRQDGGKANKKSPSDGLPA